jgi:hypothetical protein
MANLHRGEIEARLGGESHRLRLTLGALAELEHAFGVGDLVGLAGRFEAARLRARDLIVIIGCGLRGAGAVVSDDEVAALSHAEGLPGYVDIVARLLAATFGEEPPARPPTPQSP